MKQTYDSDEAVPVAQEIISMLRPFCERIEIVGSLRRCAEVVGDIELLFIPVIDTRQLDMFSSEPVDLAEECIGMLVAQGTLLKRPNVKGGFTWGRLNKLGVHSSSGIPVDLFCEPNEANWSRSIVIRTGPKEFNIRLINGAARLGIAMHAYGDGFTDKVTGRVIPCKTEREVFEICGCVYIDPSER